MTIHPFQGIPVSSSILFPPVLGMAREPQARILESARSAGLVIDPVWGSPKSRKDVEICGGCLSILFDVRIFHEINHPAIQAHFMEITRCKCKASNTVFWHVFSSFSILRLFLEIG